MLIIISAFCFCSNNSFAHPHAWVYTSAGFNVKNKMIESVSVHWVFDEMYSSTFMLEVDENNNNKLEKSEKDILKARIVPHLYDYLSKFIFLWFDNKRIEDYKFEDLKVSYDQDKETLIYDFKLKLKKNIPLKGNHKIGFMDETYYTSYEQLEKFSFPKNSKCKMELKEDTSIELLGGMLNPEMYYISCE